MARFARTSDEDMLASLLDAEEDSSDGLKVQAKKPRREKTPPPRRQSKPRVSTPQIDTTPQAEPPQRQQVSRPRVEPRRDEPILQRTPSQQRPPSRQKPPMDSTSYSQQPQTPQTPPVDEPVELSLDSLDSIFPDVEPTIEEKVQKEEEFIPFQEDMMSIPEPSGFQNQEPRLQQPPAPQEPVLRPEPTPPVDLGKTPESVEIHEEVYEVEEPKKEKKSRFSHIKLPGSEEPEVEEVKEEKKVIEKPETSKRDDIELADVVIKLYKAIKKLTDEERMIAAQFISSEEGIADDYARFAIAAINADKMLTPTLSAITQAKEFSSVDRAFYVMGLDEDLLQSVGGLAEVLSESDIEDTIENKIGYSREVVGIVDELSEEAMSYVKATESVINVVRLNEKSKQEKETS